jgi:hypothetical protein
MAERPTIHIEAVQFTPGLEPVNIHCSVGGVPMIVSTTQKELGWTTDDPEIVAAAEAGVAERLGATLKVKLPDPPKIEPGEVIPQPEVPAP